MRCARSSAVWRWTAAAALLAGVHSAPAQVGGPIDYRTGDANNQIGSGGYNRLSNTFIPNTANLFITGNVTGGRSFRAFSPVRDPHTLTIGLPSSGLDAFRRDSVSVDNVLLGQTPGTVNPYYSRQRTTSSLNTLLGGFDQFSNLRSPDILTIPRGTSTYTYGLGRLPAYGFGSSAPTTEIGAGQIAVPGAHTSAFLQPVSTFAPLTREVGSLFGVVPTTQRFPYGSYGGSAGLAGQPRPVDPLTRSAFLQRQAQGNLGELIDPMARRDPLTGRVVVPEFELDLASDGAREVEPRTYHQPLPTEADAGVETDPSGIHRASMIPLFAPEGLDLYADMQAAHAFLVYQQEQQAELQTALARQPTLASQYAEAVSAARRMIDQPPESFAGSGDTAVQHLLRRGEELLRAGQYYQAKSFFERAEFLDRHNPLILLAHGHAMLAAGEYYSAALRLSRAVELFPGIAYFKLDLTKFIPEPDLLEKRRADLERRLEVKEDYRFRFVLGYTECFSGLQKYGLENLRRAAELAPENSGIARLHRLMTMNPPAPTN